MIYLQLETLSKQYFDDKASYFYLKDFIIWS